MSNRLVFKTLLSWCFYRKKIMLSLLNKVCNTVSSFTHLNLQTIISNSRPYFIVEIVFATVQVPMVTDWQRWNMNLNLGASVKTVLVHVFYINLVMSSVCKPKIQIVDFGFWFFPSKTSRFQWNDKFILIIFFVPSKKSKYVLNLKFTQHFVKPELINVSFIKSKPSGWH